MSLPSFAPFPPASIRLKFSVDEWHGFLEAWTMLSGAYLNADDKTFKTISETPTFCDFLRSFYEQWSPSNLKTITPYSPHAHTLTNQCFSLVARCSNSNSQHELFADLAFLSDFARAHVKSPLARSLLSEIWLKGKSTAQRALQKWKTTAVTELDAGGHSRAEPSISAITPLLYSCPEAAAFMMTGSDFLEAANTAYSRNDKHNTSRSVVLIVYIGLAALIRDGHSGGTALSDHVYSLRAAANSHNGTTTLVNDLVTNTPIMKAIKRFLPADKSHKLIEILSVYRMPSIARRKRSAKAQPAKKQSNGKQRAEPDHEMHIHRLSLVTQIQDLFPDLGAGFVLRLLDEYNDNVEEVTAHLLDDALPPHLAILDRSEQAPVFSADRQTAIEHLAPRSTPPLPDAFIPKRANVFDDDDFDRLEVDTSKLHIGKKPDQEDAVPKNKAAIMSALAAFDADDDERDDTYDVEDVGGTVDTAHHDGDDTAIGMNVDTNDLLLYQKYQTEPEAFSRSAETRRSKGRATLKTETGMTDEAIEGWAIMLQRDPKRANRLALEANKFDGKQTELMRTSFRDNHDTDTDGSDAGPGNEGRGRGRGGFRGRGRGRGGSVAGASNDPSTAQAQRRKEANKSSRANHNRRDQRARKMARGGFPPT